MLNTSIVSPPTIRKRNLKGTTNVFGVLPNNELFLPRIRKGVQKRKNECLWAALRITTTLFFQIFARGYKNCKASVFGLLSNQDFLLPKIYPSILKTSALFHSFASFQLTSIDVHSCAFAFIGGHPSTIDRRPLAFIRGYPSTIDRRPFIRLHSTNFNRRPFVCIRVHWRSSINHR